jgi:nitroreductase
MDGAVSDPGRPGMSVSEAVESRRSIRAFLDRPVPTGLVLDVLRRAARAPSGGNLQPWMVHVIEGQRLLRLKALMRQRCAETPDGEPMAYSFYPSELKPHHTARRTRNGHLLYGALGVDREDKAARKRWIDENFQFFGAPFGLFFLMERAFGPSQWLDLGLYLQSVMLLLREAGLDTCPQADWALYERTVLDFLSAPADLTLICGMAVGTRDPAAPINQVVTERDDPVVLF